jgi:hypothetical protein
MKFNFIKIIGYINGYNSFFVGLIYVEYII